MNEDIKITIENVGDFVFSRPTIRKLMEIDRHYEALIGEASRIVRLNVLASMVSIYKATMVSCPEGWEDLETMPGHRDEQIAQLLMAYRGQEDSFRQESTKGS